MLCKGICQDSISEITKVTQVVKSQLIPFSDVLKRVWSLKQRSSDVFEKCSAINPLLFQASQERSVVLKALTAVSLLP